jgi:hypothetical protein
MVPHHTKIFWDLLLWIVNEPRPHMSGTLNQEGSSQGRIKSRKGWDFTKKETKTRKKTKKSGLKVVTLIATLNPVSQVLW